MARLLCWFGFHRWALLGDGWRERCRGCGEVRAS